jgi:serine/threonine-protein kinase
LPVASPDPLLGQFAGSYRIEAVLGAGGMGRVYRAEHPDLGRSAAVKVLALNLTGDADLVRRFRLEAQAVGRLAHPNIVGVLDFGTLPDGRPFYIMELLRGESLAQFLARVGRVSVEIMVAILDPVLAALEAAHGEGIVHRDLKPENVFLCASGGGYVPKLLDFGVAKLVDPHATTPHTQTGSLLGTPTYMSPEQASGQTSKIGPPSDLYAVGVMAYEMLTGRPPFQAAHLGELILKHLQEQPPRVRELRPDVPEDVDALLQMVLAKDPGERPQSAQALRRALRSIAQPQPITVVEYGTPTPRVAHGTPPKQEAPAPAASPAPAPAPAPQAAPTERTRPVLAPALAIVAALFAVAAVAVVLLRQRGAPPAAGLALVPPDAGLVQGPVTVAVPLPDAAPPAAVAAASDAGPAPAPAAGVAGPRTAHDATPRAKKRAEPAGPPEAPVRPPRSSEAAEALKKEAKEAAALQDYDLAYRKAVAAVEAAPDDQEAIFLAGHSACMRGQEADAKRWYGRLDDKRMKDALDDICARFKQIYVTPRSKDSPAARSGRALELYPDAVDLMHKDPAKALEMAKEIIDLQPSFEGGWIVAAGASCRLGRVDDVKKYLKRVPERMYDIVKMSCEAAKVPFPDPRVAPDAGTSAP